MVMWRALVQTILPVLQGDCKLLSVLLMVTQIITGLLCTSLQMKVIMLRYENMTAVMAILLIFVAFVGNKHTYACFRRGTCKKLKLCAASYTA